MSDSEAQPLLVDADVADNAGRSPPQHFCARCSSELQVHQDHKETKPWTLRHILIIVAMILSCIIFILAIAEMSTAKWFESPSILQIFVTLWTDVTMTLLGLLLYFGRRSQVHRKWGRTAVQIKVLCVLGVSWIIFVIAMITQNTSACQRRRWRDATVTCGLFTTVHVFSWFLVITLFSAAYATYRKAVVTHGTNMVPLPNPPMVAAWRLSNIADVGGAIKI
ncbi:hypothetical protein FB451DRAFT_1263746 [Mycena latifolia]|nr:hypothetical protein FB451DRAFT_1263746 [Mycena latifolia]